MNSDRRYRPSMPFPVYRLIPGVNSHPSEMIDLDLAEAISEREPGTNDFFCHSIDLYNAEYFWESHVYFEALWKVHGKHGTIADFLKGMIQLGAAGVKLKMNQPDVSQVLLARAKKLFQSVEKVEASVFLGFNLREIIIQIEQVMVFSDGMFRLQPKWSE